MPEDEKKPRKKKGIMRRLRRRKEPGMKGVASILVGADFSEASECAFRLAQSLLGPTGTIYVIHVTPDIVANTGKYLKDPAAKELQRSVTEQAMKKLTGWADKNLKINCKIEYVISAGDPSAELIKAAKAKFVQLVVLGVHGRKRVDLCIMGSTVEKVVRESHCPVICVPTERV